MINRVTIAGRLVEAPARGREGAVEVLRLRLEVDESAWDRAGTRGASAGAGGRCVVPVEARGPVTEVLERWLGPGRPLLVTGHLAARGGAVVVALEQFQFVSDEVEPRPLWLEGGAPRGGGRARPAAA